MHDCLFLRRMKSFFHKRQLFGCQRPTATVRARASKKGPLRRNSPGHPSRRPRARGSEVHGEDVRRHRHREGGGGGGGGAADERYHHPRRHKPERGRRRHAEADRYRHDREARRGHFVGRPPACAASSHRPSSRPPRGFVADERRRSRSPRRDHHDQRNQRAWHREPVYSPPTLLCPCSDPMMAPPSPPQAPIRPILQHQHPQRPPQPQPPHFQPSMNPERSPEREAREARAQRWADDLVAGFEADIRQNQLPAGSSHRQAVVSRLQRRAPMPMRCTRRKPVLTRAPRHQRTRMLHSLPVHWSWTHPLKRQGSTTTTTNRAWRWRWSCTRLRRGRTTNAPPTRRWRSTEQEGGLDQTGGSHLRRGGRSGGSSARRHRF